MKAPLFLPVSEFAPRTLDMASSNTGDRIPHERDKAWSRALEQAQQLEYANWFTPPPANSEPGAPPGRPTISLAAPSLCLSSKVAIPSGDAHPAASRNLRTNEHSGDTFDAESPASENSSGAMAINAPQATSSTAINEAPRSMGEEAHSMAASRIESKIGLMVGSSASSSPPTAMTHSQDASTIQTMTSALGQDLARHWLPQASAAALPPETGSGLAHVNPNLAILNTNQALGLPKVAFPFEALRDSATPKEEFLAAASKTPPFRGSTSAQEEPLRLHAEWSDQGVRVWLGASVDQSLPLTQLARYVQQWLASHGERLRSLVCNGREVWRDTLNEPADQASAGSAASIPEPSNAFETPLKVAIPYSQEAPCPAP